MALNRVGRNQIEGGRLLETAPFYAVSRERGLPNASAFTGRLIRGVRSGWVPKDLCTVIVHALARRRRIQLNDLIFDEKRLRVEGLRMGISEADDRLITVNVRDSAIRVHVV